MAIVQSPSCAVPSQSMQVPHAVHVFQQPFTDIRLDNCKKYDLDKSGLKGKADDGECSSLSYLFVIN